MSSTSMKVVAYLIGLLVAFCLVGGVVASLYPAGQRRIGFVKGGWFGIFMSLLNEIAGLWGLAVLAVIAIWMYRRGYKAGAVLFILVAVLFYGVGPGEIISYSPTPQQ